VGRRRICRALIPAAVLIVSGLAAGCTSASAEATASASANPPAYCAATAELKTSVQALRSVDVINGGISAVQTAVSMIQSELSAFQTAAKAQFGPDVTALRTSLANLQSVLTTAAGGQVNASTLVSVVGDVSGVVSAYSTLQTAVSSRCG
jgi:hypothetical protein